ncbi:MAG: hypothetical protein IPO90_08565 [Flavobacteriales bacterium]|nr:hypothetical protein [Flavobacteriales bacterium]
MRIGTILSLLALLFASCSCDPDTEAGSIPLAQPVVTKTRSAVDDPCVYDLVQTTCALYVAVRSASLEKPVAFGNDINAGMVRSNMCPALEVACRAMPAPSNHQSSRSNQ